MQVQVEIYAKALQTEGFFTEAEGKYLMQTVAEMPAQARMLEVGSYHGRSTLFVLSVLGLEQRWVVVDNFQPMANCSQHSFVKLFGHVGDSRVIILPGAFADLRCHLSNWQFDLIFIDADHSFLGFSQDIALAISLGLPGATLLCHDVSKMFPGVALTLEALQRVGVIKQEGLVHSLGRFRICKRPTWLTESSVFQGEEL